MNSSPQTLEDLLAIEAIKQLKAQYFLYLDTKQWDPWRDLFTDDVRIEGGPSHESLDAFVDFVRRHLEGAQTCHHGHMPIIEVTGETTARGTWAMSDDVTFPPEHPWAGEFLRQCGYGHYHEEYRRGGDRWRIAAMRLSRLSLWSEPDDRVNMTERGWG